MPEKYIFKVSKGKVQDRLTVPKKLNLEYVEVIPVDKSLKKIINKLQKRGYIR